MPVLTDAQRASYDDWGYCVLPAAFDPADAAVMAARTWLELDQEMGIRLDEPTTWRYVKGTDFEPLRRTQLRRAP